MRQLAPGTMLDDKYRIDGLLAVGGMGAVYVGTHTKLRKKVAIKVLNPQIASPAMSQRFQREAITASQIGHEGIAQVTDLGTSTTGESFLVMELLEGESLAKRLQATGPLPVEIACELGCAILSPLAAAHAAGIVHRDLKPDNVFLVRQSRGEMVKLLDFGISRAAGLEAEFRLTNTGVVMGTPFYMSPEQARGDHEVGPAADIYSFGVILYEMLIGQVPIKGDNYNQLMYRVMTGDFQRPTARRPDLPAALENIIVRAMALMPEARPSSAVELEGALLEFCRPTYREHMVERMSNAGIPWGTPAPLLRASAPVLSSSSVGQGVVGVTQGTDPTLMAPSGILPAPTVVHRRSKLPLILVAAVLVGGGLAAVAAMKMGGETVPAQPVAATEPVPTPAPTPPPTPAPTPPPAAPAPATITLKFAIEPATATILLDGKPITGVEHVVTKDDAEHTLEITAKGHKPHAEKLRFDDNQKLVIQLERAATKPAPAPRPTGKPGKPGKTKPDRIESESPYQ